MSSDFSVVLDQGEIARSLKRIAHEIIEHNKGTSNLVIVGIPTRGSHLAARLTQMLSTLEATNVAMGTLDTTCS
ncbi:MAG: bifunctional pyr operon transcriptional regulator/uracil phosphoribosyltransferase, partial [Aquiluna sp.]